MTKEEFQKLSDVIQLQNKRILKLEFHAENTEQRVTSMQKTLNEMHELLLQGKGARWVIGLLLIGLPFIGYSMVDLLKAAVHGLVR